MKFKFEQKYINLSIYVFLIFAASLLFYLGIVQFPAIAQFFKNLSRIFLPITIGLVMAYLFNFFLVIYEEKLLKKYNDKPKTKRVLGLILTYITVFIILASFLKFILPQLMESLSGIINEIPNYIRDVSIFINNLAEKLDFDHQFNAMLLEKVNEVINYFMNLSSNLIPMIANIGISIISSIWNIVIGLIISIYILSDKEKFSALAKKVNYAILPKNGADKALELTRLADRIFGSFIGGKILDSAIIGVLTFIVLLIFQIPYALLVAFIIGITNIIPFFGPFIGAVPAFFIIFFISSQKAFLFLFLIFVIQQIDGNIIGPKILGGSLGISSFWILFSLLIGGKLFGILGMIIGVPAFVFIYEITKEILEARLRKKELPTNIEDYL